MKSRDELYVEYFDEGIKHLENKNFAAAVEAFTRVLAQQETVDGLLKRATALLELNNLELATIDIEASRTKMHAMRSGNYRPRARTDVTSDLKLMEKMHTEVNSRLQKAKNTLSANLDDFVRIDGNALPPAPDEPNRELAREFNNQGATALNKKNASPAAVIGFFSKSIESCHTSVGFYNRARAYFLNKEYNLAYEDMKSFSQMPARPSLEFDAALLYTDIFHALGRHAEALEKCRYVLPLVIAEADKAPGNYKHHTKLGSIYYRMGEYAKAESSFTRSLECLSRENIGGRYIDRSFTRLRTNNLIGAFNDYRIIISMPEILRNEKSVKLHRMLYNTTYFADSNEVLADECYQAAVEHKSHEDDAEAMMDLLLACKHNPSHPNAEKKLKAIVFKLDKSKIVEMIGHQNIAVQIALYKQCLDQRSPLGKRIWHTEILTPCQLSKGTLKVISDRLAVLQPNAHEATPVEPDEIELALIRNAFAPEELRASEDVETNTSQRRTQL